MSKSHYIPMHQKNKKTVIHPPPSMSVSPLMISISDEEDAHILEHEVAIERAKCMKEERQRQQEEEAQEVVEAEKAQREAEDEKAHREAEAEEAQRTAEVEEAQRRAKEEERAQKEAKRV